MKYRSRVSTATGAELALRRVCTFVAAHDETYPPATDYPGQTYDAFVIGYQFTGETVMRIGGVEHRIKPGAV